jgi:apolipoprotein N-acyltransferase
MNGAPSKAGALAGLAARLAARLATVAGWRRWLIAFLLGATAIAAQPPVHFLPALLIAFPGLVWLLDGARSPRAAFGIGWMFGAGYFAAGLYWVSNALLVDAARFAWLIPFALIGLSLGLGLFIGATTFAARYLWSSGAGRVFALAASWTFFEMVRGTVLTGFPWNPVGNVWVVVAPVLQTASWLGVYGLSAITVFAAAAIVMCAGAERSRWWWALSGLAVICVLAIAGALRLSDAGNATVPGVVLRIVQPNIAQADKWAAARRAQNYARHLQMSRAAGETSGTSGAVGAVTHVIWPETAAPFSVATDAVRRSLMRQSVPAGGLLLTGSIRLERRNDRISRVWNSLVAVDDKTGVAAVYDKHHLVPFGEYMPFREFLPFDKITAGALDFSAGPGPRTLRLAGLPAFSPLICYEVIFPGQVVDEADRPAWLLNITNDAWFGTSAGPHQHFASARMRAVEEGLPLVRAANTGVSGVIDAFGRVTAKLGLDRAGVLDATLPAAAQGRTLFSLYGNVLPGILVVLMAIAAAYCVRKR